MKYNQTLALCAALLLAGPGAAVWAQDSTQVAAVSANRLESLDVVDQGGVTYVRARFKEDPKDVPASFSVA